MLRQILMLVILLLIFALMFQPSVSGKNEKRKAYYCQTERTVAGECCVFPFVYKGVKYYRCTTTNHGRPWCSTTDYYIGKWGNCRASGCVQRTVAGQCCVFPFIYKGVKYYRCTTTNHGRPWCSTTDYYVGKWGNCQPTGCVQSTVDGKCCVFPFVYKGVKYYKCTHRNHNKPWCSTTATYKGKWGNCQGLQKRTTRYSQFTAFSNDINACLFTAWTTASGSKNAVLSQKVNCRGRYNVGLCYGTNHRRAQFAVCFNKQTLVPNYTGHIVEPNIKEGGGRDAWHNDDGPYAPVPSSSEKDYDAYNQRGLYPHYDTSKGQFLSRGHYTPNADYSPNSAEREMTMVNTNIAPQWQLFNSENWAALEKAIRDYATSVRRNIYVFTGTGGKATNPSTGNKILLNKRVVTPRYYWKAICDPGVGSVMFMGVNNVGVVSDVKVKGCYGREQTQKYGIITCYSLDAARKAHKARDFHLPPFNAKCKTNVLGTFINLTKLK